MGILLQVHFILLYPGQAVKNQKSFAAIDEDDKVEYFEICWCSLKIRMEEIKILLTMLVQ